MVANHARVKLSMRRQHIKIDQETMRDLSSKKSEADKTDLVVGRGHVQKEATFAEDVPGIAEVPTEDVEESDEMDDFEDSSAVDFDDFEGRLDQMGRDHGST